MPDQCADVASLRDWLNEADRDRRLHGLAVSVALADLAHGTSLGGRLPELVGRSVLVATGDQLTAALALIELDGVARRLILCPPDLAANHLPTVIADGEVDAIVTSGQMDASGELGVRLHVVCHPAIAPMARRPAHAPTHDGARRATEWVMFTSGTTGAPKMVVHTFAGLTGAIKRNAAHDVPVV
jgi:non-ribosomal peptide synthetase component F